MVDGPTYCEDCDCVTEETRKQAPWSWLCMKHINVWDGFVYVTKNTWDKQAPYLKCSAVNGGACLLFEPKREGEVDAKE